MRKISFILLTLLIVGTNAWADYVPTKENLEAREWFQDAKFGLFVHWGVYSVRGRAEWVLYNDKIQLSDYEKLPEFFNPIEFNAAEWVATVKNAGMKYITITSKHHDGFCMFDSKLTDWDIVDRTPYGKDVLKQLADECHKQGVKLFFYYSQLDWHNPDYWPLGRTGDGLGKPAGGNWQDYLDYQNGQLTELLTNYGEISGIWFDGWWDKEDADWDLVKTYKVIHDLQPACLITNNRHEAPLPGEDFQAFEKDLPGQNTTGFGSNEIGALPMETCETMNHSWGFNLTDHSYKSTHDLVQYLVKAAGNNANFLLNVGPMPNGKIQPEFVKTLGEIGDWMDVYGATIYGTRKGPVPQRNWGVTTMKGNTVYVHILNWEDPVLSLPPLEKKVKKATVFNTTDKVKVEQNKSGILLYLPSHDTKMADYIIQLEF